MINDSRYGRSLLACVALAALLGAPPAEAQRQTRSSARTNVNSSASSGSANRGGNRSASANSANANSAGTRSANANTAGTRSANANSASANTNRANVNNANVNRNVNNTNVNNINVNRNVNVDVDNGWDNDGWDHHPVAAGMAFGTAAAITAAAIGSIAYSLPPSCAPVMVNGVTYQQCGGTWYQPQYAGSQVTYVVVNPPR